MKKYPRSVDVQNWFSLNRQTESEAVIRRQNSGRSLSDL